METQLEHVDLKHPERIKKTLLLRHLAIQGFLSPSASHIWHPIMVKSQSCSDDPFRMSIKICSIDFIHYDKQDRRVPLVRALQEAAHLHLTMTALGRGLIFLGDSTNYF